MSLLTEKQLDEIIEVIRDAVNVEFPHTLRGEIHEWNKKQTGVQVRLNWDLAPPSATKAELQIAWYNSSNFLVSEDVLGFIPRPTTPHPHAEIIAKYAEVAARRCDPWVEFEWTSGEVGSEDWKVCHAVNTGFNYGRRYRHIGDKQ